MDIEKTIRNQRSAYNVAISARNLTAIDGMLAPQYVVLPGSTGTPQLRQELLSLFAQSFQDPSFITYVRIAEHIQPSSSYKRIAETGRWTGTWNNPDGLMTLSGVYQAVWIIHCDAWKLINESFVTLHCAGSRECLSVE